MHGPAPHFSSDLFVAAPTSFDGNLTCHLSNWLIPTSEWEGLTESAMRSLVEALLDDNLAWMILVWNGYRV